jgi:hypothetical protein
MFAIMIAIGIVTFLVGWRSDPTRAYASYLIGYVYVLGLGLAGTFFTALHYLVGATWSVVVRRVAEAFSSYLRSRSCSSSWVLLGSRISTSGPKHPSSRAGTRST